MWDYIITFIVGAAVPITISWLQQKNERKRFLLERKDKYKFIAIEKRLEAHQQAFNQWYKLKTIIHEKETKKRNRVLRNATKFYCNNSLYLERKTREEFYKTIMLVSSYPDFLANWNETEDREQKKKAHEELVQNWNTIYRLPEIIQSDVELEPIRFDAKETPEGKTES